MRIGLILNRKAGKGIDDATVDQLLQEFERKHMNVVVGECSGVGLDEAFKHVSSYHPDAIVSAGGDGTASAVAVKLAGTSVPMGVVPAGTANHFAKDLGVPDSLEAAVNVIAARRIVSVDVAEVNGRVFLNNSSIGIYPIAVHLRKEYQRKLGWSKRFAMLRAMFKVFREFPMFTVRLDTDKGEYFRKTSFVFVGNNEYVLGEREDLTGGILTVYTAHMKGRWGILVMGLLSFVNNLGEKYFDRHLVKTLELDTHKKKMIVSLDGEVVEMPPPLRYSIRPKALNVFLPPNDTR